MVAWMDVLDEILIDVTADKQLAIIVIKGKKVIFRISEHKYIDRLMQGKATLSKIDTASIEVLLQRNATSFTEVEIH
jgi:hypothetical protein